MFQRIIFSLLLLPPLLARGASPHVVLVIWDGMRPDFANEKYAPTLNQLAQEGVRFRNHHAAYFTATDVNGAALATGSSPQRNGLFANLEYLPAIDPLHPVDTGAIETIRRGDEVSGGKYLAVPTFVELLRQAGKSVALAGSKSVAVLFDRMNDWIVREMTDRPLTIFAGAPLFAGRQTELRRLLGPFHDGPNDSAEKRNVFATRALTEILWRDGVPDFSLLWLSQPDWSEHNFAPGSPEAIAAIKASDENLRAVLEALAKKNARESTTVFVASDHGFSTIRRSFDLVATLRAAGFHADKTFSPSPSRGDVLLCGNGGSVAFYVHEHDGPTLERLVRYFQKADYVDTLFTRDGIAETKRLADVSLDVAAPPDLVLAFKWSSEKNKFGIPGMIDADWNRAAGQGTHASLSEFDRHNLLIGAGGRLRQNFESDLSSSNIDLAPTIMDLLGATGGDFQGRALREAYAESAPAK